MMAKTEKVTVDAETLENAQKTWDSFVVLTKYSIYAVVAVLVVMGATLINWS